MNRNNSLARAKMRIKYLLALSAAIVISCTSNDDTCEVFPREYEYTFDDNVLVPLSLYEYDGTSLILSSQNVDDAFRASFGDESPSDVTGGLMSTITIINDTLANIIFDSQDLGIRDISVGLTPFAPGQLLATELDSGEPIALLGVSDDCTTISRCLFVAVFKVENEWQNFQDYTVCYDNTEQEIIENHESLSFWQEGDQLLLLQTVQEYTLK